MPHTSRPRITKAIFIPPLFWCVFLLPAILLFVLPVATQDIRVETLVSSFSVPSESVEASKPIANALPMASNVPKVQLLSPVPTKVQKTSLISPNVVQSKAQAHLLIPRIQVNAVIKSMGVTSGGAMAVPGNRVDVGWYSLGTKPGEIGSAVVGGHNDWNGGSGVFVHLDQLKVGDMLSVVDAAGVSTSFMVREMRTFAATDQNSGIFASTSGAHLNLITCSGVWDPVAQSYTTRLVVFTDAQAA